LNFKLYICIIPIKLQNDTSWMKHLLYALTICILFVGCNHSKRSTTKITQLIPETATVVLSINNIETFKSDIKNNGFLKKLKSSIAYKDLLNPLENLSYLNTTNTILICFNGSKSKPNYSIITKYSDSLFSNKNIDSLNFHHRIIDSIFIGSPSKVIIDSIIVTKNSAFKTLDQVTNTNASFSISLNENIASNFGNSLFTENTNAFANWITLDAEITPDLINLNGVSIVNDTISRLINVFKNTIPQENKIQYVTPESSDGFISFTYNDFEILYENITEFNQQTIDTVASNELLETITEVGEIYIKNETAVVLKSIDEFSTKEALSDHQNVLSSFRNVEILAFENPKYFKTIFNPLISVENMSMYINIDDFFVFANSKQLLQDIITNFQNGNTLSNNSEYLKTALSVSDEASLFVVATPSKLKHILKGTFNENITNLNLKDYKYSAFQFVQDDGFVHVNVVIKKNKSRAQQHAITEAFNVSLDADVLTNPKFVINHRNKQKDIVVQDVNNNLYLISNTGKVLWKKQLRGYILGSMQQVDLYRNGRLQLAFATPNRVYVLDRNGKDVAPFPLKFNDKITQPLSVFDYDNKKNYRFVVTQNKALLMYDKKGKSINGFKYKKTSNSITTKPKHFRINNKDYIVFAAGNKMMILNRKGQSRINVKEAINFSENEIFKYKNKFTTTTTKGELVQVNLKGAVSKQSLNLPSNHVIKTTNKTLVTLAENKLTIKQKRQELDFGNYTAPKIFYLNDKIYVTVTDLQAQKVYLFDSQSKPILNFPVYGNSIIDLANIDSDNNLEFITKGESNAIIVYQKN
jgi:hypothetical protein